MGIVPFLVITLVLVIIQTVNAGPFRIGIASYDVTGPSAEVTFMGYAKAGQTGQGIHLRQFARAYVFDDVDEQIVYVSVDGGMMGHGVRMEVLKKLSAQYGPDRYTERNVIISGTHSHSTPGGFLEYLLYDISILGFCKETFQAYVDGIFNAIVKAHENLQEAKMFLSSGDLLDANINRSPSAYLANPPEERANYIYDVDKTMVQLRFVTADEKQTPLGAIHWFAVHPTSMNNTNHLVSSDNVGFAAVLFDKEMNNGSLTGTGSFVSLFASTNLGDVSPNIMGPKCQNTGLPCDVETSTCPKGAGDCVASGPGKDIFESTKIIASRIAAKAKELWTLPGRQITGPLKIVHQYVDMPSQKVPYTNSTTNETITVQGCKAAMGYSFAAGTVDGPGAFSFEQGTTTDNPLWNLVRDFLWKPSKEQIKCQAPKPILINTGELPEEDSIFSDNISFPYEWQPRIVPTQLALLGSDLALVAMPGELTTMSGRRMRNAIRKAIADAGGALNTDVVIAGLSNIYTSYIATPDEYTVQRYEGASTIYGPHTLTIYLHQYTKLATALVKNEEVDEGPVPPQIKHKLSLITPVLFDLPAVSRKFGDCISQPAKTAKPGDIVSAKFVGAHPRNDRKTGKTYLAIERNDGGDNWTMVANDAEWETKFIWHRTIGAVSEVRIVWEIPAETKSGEYRIHYYGTYKYIFGGLYDFDGKSNSIQVQ